MAKILILGGHGKIALLTHPELVEHGDSVTAVIRNPEHADEVAATGATPLVADLERLEVPEIADLIAGHDAVVWSAGAGGGNPARTWAVDRDAAMRSIEAAARAGVRRYVMVSYFGATQEHGLDPEHSFYAYAEAKSAADEYLRGSDLDWTILAPSSLTLDPASGTIDVLATEATQVSRGNVAHVIAATLHEPGTIGKTVRFNDGSTPIAQALASV